MYMSMITGNRLDRSQFTTELKGVYQNLKLYPKHQCLAVKIEPGFIGVGQAAKVHGSCSQAH